MEVVVLGLPVGVGGDARGLQLLPQAVLHRVQVGAGEGQGLPQREAAVVLPVVDPGGEGEVRVVDVLLLAVEEEVEVARRLRGVKQALGAGSHPGDGVGGLAAVLLKEVSQLVVHGLDLQVVFLTLRGDEGGDFDVVAQLVVILQLHGEGGGGGRLLGLAGHQTAAGQDDQSHQGHEPQGRALLFPLEDAADAQFCLLAGAGQGGGEGSGGEVLHVGLLLCMGVE